MIPSDWYCARCARPIQGGPVIRGREAFCSFECAFAAPSDRVSTREVESAAAIDPSDLGEE
jgi:hypothetical protein